MTKRMWTRALTGVLMAAPAILVPTSQAGADAAADAAPAQLTIVEDARGTARAPFQFGGTLGRFELPGTRRDNTISFEAEPGRHRVRQQQFSQWALTSITCTTAAGDIFPATVDIERGTVELTLAAGDDVTCVFENSRAIIVNTRAGHDANRNGRIDPGESWIEGATVELYFSDERTLEKTHITNANGRTRFVQFRDTYYVCLVIPDGWVTTRNYPELVPGRACAGRDELFPGQQVWHRLLVAAEGEHRNSE